MFLPVFLPVLWCGHHITLWGDNMAEVTRFIPRSISRPGLLGIALVSTVLLSACAEIGEPDLGVGSATPTATSDGAAEPELDQEDDTEATEEDVEATPLPVFSPPRPDGYVPSLAVVGTTSAVIIDEISQLDLTQDPDQSATTEADVVEGQPTNETLFLTGDAVPDRLVDDFFGGLVIEDVRPDEEGVDARTVTWLRPADPTGTVLATGVGLLDVGFIDSTLEAHVLVDVDGSSVDRIKLVDGERAPFASLAEGQTLVDLSASEGLHAVIFSDAECGDLVFWNSSGEPVDIGGPVPPTCEVARRPAYGAVDLSPDATLVAYTALTYRSDGVVATTDVIVRELGSGAVVFTIPVGAVGQEVRALSFDGTRLAFIREETDLTEVVVLNTIDSVETIVPVALTPVDAVFARQPLVVGRGGAPDAEQEPADE